MSEREDEHLISQPGGNQVINASDQRSDLRPSGAEAAEAAAKKKKIIKWGLIGGAITIVVVLAIVLPIVLSNKTTNPDGPDPVNPNPYTYMPYTKMGEVIDSEDQVRGYIYAEEEYNGTLHAVALQTLVSGLNGTDPKLDPKLFVTYPHRIPEGDNNKFIKNISYNFAIASPSVGLLTITDANHERFSIPREIVNKPDPSILQKMEMLGFKLFKDPFGFQFADLRDANNVYVHTNDSTLVMMDKFIQMDLQLPSQRMYGLGERVREFQLGEGTWTMWARGADSPYDDGTGSKQVYGVHPFVLVQSKKKGDFFGMWFRNSNAQSPLIKFNQKTGGATLSYITIGGQIEIVFFFHGSAKSVLAQYHNMIGNPELPPFWSLGWNQASWAYDTQDQVQKVIDNYAASKIPLENMWLDITYLDNYADFSIDKKAFPDLKKLADTLHDNRQQLVVILDAGLSADDLTNKYYKMAQELDVLIKTTIHTDDPTYNGALVMKVWPNHTVFIDWLHENASQVWQTGLLDLYNQVQWDGIWIDMNEATGFTDGELDTSPTKPDLMESFREKVARFLADTNPQDQWYQSFPQDQNSTWYLPFVPGYSRSQQNLDHMAMSLNATHPQSGNTEYDLHNLYGLMMSEHTRAFMTGSKLYNRTDNRPFILTRSTFSGSGKYAAHWLGDNWREWGYMNYSIAGIMNMNMFGIPMVGADVCGFFGSDMDQDMCSRWIQLATFYPFARGHYNRTWNGEDLKGGTEPYNLEGNYLTMARNSIYDRYQYLRHMYTCLYETMMTGGTCLILFYYYPTDDNLFQNYEASFMVGGALKVSPILNPGVKDTDTFPSYFPEGKWVSMINYGDIITGPATVQLKSELTVNVHLRPGSLIPFQDNLDHSISKTAQLIEAPISIIANRDAQGKASGYLLLEKGLSRSEINDNHYEYYTINIQANSLQKTLTRGTHASQTGYLDKFVLVNAEDLKDVDFACVVSTHFETKPMKTAYDADKKTLTISYQPADLGDHLQFQQFRQINYGVTGKDLNICDQKSYSYHIKGDYKPDLSKSSETFILENDGSTKLPDLNITMRVVNTNTVNVKWTFATVPNNYRKPFEVPLEIINVTSKVSSAKLSNYITIINDAEENFGIMIKNGNKDSVISITEMLFDQNLNIINAIHNTTYGDNFKGIFGLGERVQGEDLFYNDGIYSMWNRDDGMPGDTGKPPGANVYGTHPFYMFKNADSSWVGVFTNLAAAQDWVVLNNKDTGEVDTTMIAVGGVADLYFIVDANPAAIVSGYLDIVGKPVLLPQWALGWHQCRWGYNTTSALVDMVKGYNDNRIPLDTAWSDIDYLYNYRDFTYDTIKFKDLPAFIKDLHNKSMHYVPIIDAGVAMRSPGQYEAYDSGVKDDIFIKINGNQTLIGQVWPKDAAYPDFFNPKTSKWWKSELDAMHKDIAFDGLWLDMNEASDFCGGVCYPEQAPLKQVKYDLPYTPTGRNLERQSIPLDATHYDGIMEIDAHSLFGTMETKASHEWFKERKNRTFIIERSSYAGLGKFGSQWLGDNFAHPWYMGQSVLGTMAMNMFGVPFVGSDICGFGGTTNAELCARWHYVGAFQPFSRNHNGYGEKAQEPYSFGTEQYEPGVMYMDIMRDAILTKYSLIRYYYTQLFSLSVLGGSAFYKPLFFEYPNDINTFNALKYNVMLGDSLKLSILSDQVGKNSSDFYFPAGTWCNVFNSSERCFESLGKNYTLRTKAQDAYVHIREGKIVPLQDAKFLNSKQVLTSIALQDQPVDLHILGKQVTYSDASWSAKGIYINDDGLNVDQNGTYNKYQIEASQVERDGLSKVLVLITTEAAFNYVSKDDANCHAVNKNDYLNKIYIYNAQKYNLNKNKHLALAFDLQGKQISGSITASYDSNSDRLIITADASKPLCLSSISFIELVKTI